MMSTKSVLCVESKCRVCTVADPETVAYPTDINWLINTSASPYCKRHYDVKIADMDSLSVQPGFLKQKPKKKKKNKDKGKGATNAPNTPSVAVGLPPT